ncbi:MAG: AbrB/MazE/SpoVT family DNA-binding domain-containing protein [Nanoarchaeota archaeon]|nr:AbrB/MazE/SpoVT family DNA-binding domain-containing protein [Nanoarchaeota archaeon]MBU1270526.1 AbrB/MazE/SpoVT family DNA-binding domain-containing protein [Nanoarchaeota archaeon]MBU1604259.1 AbrB/MazE/SpoVT family DNA-binding domain-containing protein [Nanoarchaeota archaeon]MBU2442840.1 AbrB/MazE/SpoVT family DNA-binding domain-containing protein [Nanoarchaeota archaeon]
MEIECTIRSWGNSLGVIIPKEVADKEKLLINDKVKITIERKDKLFHRVFGIGKTNKKIDFQKEINEIKKGWENERLLL